MAAPAVLRVSGPPLCPSFAEVCSFLERYGPALDLPEMTFPQMERYLRDTTAVPKPLVELHVKLLRKLGRSVTTDRWEKYLAKVCQELNSTWAWELEQKGYQEMSLEFKSSILKYLCECQFDDNLKFKTLINFEDPEKMRLLPIGRDRQGLIYWFQLDQEQNIRLYTEEQDDLDGSTWKCIVRTRNDLAEALDLLKAQVEPNQKDQNQSGSRSLSPAGKDAGEDVCGTSDITLNKSTGSKKEDEETEENLKTEVVKQEEAPSCRQEKEEPKVKEEKTEEKLSAFDNRVSTITAIKSEARDAAAPQNAVSVVMATHVTFTKINKEEEAERAVVRSNQQAKIPLKKRDLKLAESFQSNHVNSSIIVCNPSVIQSKDGRARDENFLNSPAGGPAVPPAQQLVVTRPEPTNGRSSLLLTHKEGQNGVVGVIGHVGVIRSPSELLKPSEQQDQNGPSSELAGAVEEEEAKRGSVLVRKAAAGGGETDLTPRSIIETQVPKNATLSKPEELLKDPERKVDSVVLSLCEETKELADDQDKKPTEEKCEKAAEQSDQYVDNGSGGGDSEKTLSTLENTHEETKESVSTCKVSKRNRKEEQEGGSVGGAGPREPLQEASSELQKEGIRLKIKIPPHRRNKRKGKGMKAEEKKREQEVQDGGTTLRRSSRICRSFASPACRSSSEATEEKKTLKKQKLHSKTTEEQEDEDDEEQSSKNDRKTEAKLKKRKGKRRPGRPRWCNRTKKRKANEEEGEKKAECDGGSESEESFKSEELFSEDACSHCGLPNHPELILLCDSCDNGYHTACLRPPLMLIPDGEWFCPPCQHKLLCEKLEEQLQNLDSALKKRERAERRRERLVYVGISVENIIPEGDEEEEEEKSAKIKDPKKSKNLGRRSTRTRKHISYRFDDFDDAIDEAIEEDVGEICDGAGKGKDISSVLSGRGKVTRRPIKAQSRAAGKRRRLNDLESDSTAVESEDEFMLSNSSDDEDFAGSGGEDEEDEDVASDGGSWDRGTRPKRREERKSKRGRKPQRRGRKRRRRGSTEEEEETEEEMDSDQFSDMTDSEAEKKRRGLRRGQHQQVNYRETSESSDNSRTSTTKKKAKGRGRPRKEHLSSDYSNASPSSRELEEEDDDEEEEKEQRRRARRLKAEEYLRRRMREKRSRHEDEEREGERERRLKKKRTEDRKRLTEEEVNVEMGRGRRREILSQQRRKRLAQMLQKRRPSTDEEDEDESEESDSSSEEDRPVRKRLNRIDSDEEEEDEEDGGRQKTAKRVSAVGMKSEEVQERGRGHSWSPSNRTPRGSAHTAVGSPAMPQNRNYPDPGGEEEEARSDSVGSLQNSPQS